MGGFFNMDNKFWRFLNRMTDIIILNLLFLVCSIPIFTIGASSTACHYTSLKLHERQEGYISKTFFKSFKENFKQATGIWLMMLAVGILLAADYVIIRDREDQLFTAVKMGLFVVMFLYLMIFVYVFPVLSRFINTVRGTFKNSFLMSFADFPRTVIMILIFVVPVIITFINMYTLTWGIICWILIGFALVSYIQMYFMDKVFDKYMPPKEEEPDPDAWSVTADDAQEEVLDMQTILKARAELSEESESAESAEESESAEAREDVKSEKFQSE